MRNSLWFFVVARVFRCPPQFGVVLDTGPACGMVSGQWSSGSFWRRLVVGLVAHHFWFAAWRGPGPWVGLSCFCSVIGVSWRGAPVRVLGDRGIGCRLVVIRGFVGVGTWFTAAEAQLAAVRRVGRLQQRSEFLVWVWGGLLGVVCCCWHCFLGLPGVAGGFLPVGVFVLDNVGRFLGFPRLRVFSWWFDRSPRLGALPLADFFGLPGVVRGFLSVGRPW